MSLNLGCRHSLGQQEELSRHEYAQILMGVKTRVVLYAQSEEKARIAANAAFDEVARLEDLFSDYRPDSELMRLCDRAGQGPVKISDELFTVLSQSQEIARVSDGAFDVTVGPMVALWRTARKTQRFPSDDDLARAKTLVDYRLLELDPTNKTATLRIPGMRLDLGGIAKGYAGDRAIAVLKQNGVASALFESGGDIVTSDSPPGSDGWVIAIPAAGEGQPKELRLHTCAISTSGDTAQFVTLNGVRYSHVVDPKTGLGLTSHFAATVIAPTGLLSDPLSTAATILGTRAAKLASQYQGTTIYLRKLPSE